MPEPLPSPATPEPPAPRASAWPPLCAAPSSAASYPRRTDHAGGDRRLTRFQPPPGPRGAAHGGGGGPGRPETQHRRLGLQDGPHRMRGHLQDPRTARTARPGREHPESHGVRGRRTGADPGRDRERHRCGPVSASGPGTPPVRPTRAARNDSAHLDDQAVLEHHSALSPAPTPASRHRPVGS